MFTCFFEVVVLYIVHLCVFANVHVILIAVHVRVGVWVYASLRVWVRPWSASAFNCVFGCLCVWVCCVFAGVRGGMVVLFVCACE